MALDVDKPVAFDDRAQAGIKMIILNYLYEQIHFGEFESSLVPVVRRRYPQWPAHILDRAVHIALGALRADGKVRTWKNIFWYRLTPSQWLSMTASKQS
jgi:hypothetical protein